MSRYQRNYSRIRHLSADERTALNGAIASAQLAKCKCNSCVVLRAMGTLRTAARGGISTTEETP